MMASTGTPLKRQRSVKFHIDESSAKPSIKITVSSDALAETLLKNNMSSTSSPVGETDEASAYNGIPSQQQPALIQIVGNCCATSGGVDGGVSNPPPNGVLCTCASGDDKRTRIALDDFTVLEFPNCIDFGIKDFLCCKDEIELDLSSDTDASYLDATPPHRFSDSELDNQIEAMSITLDTQLNPFPNNGFLVRSSIDADEDEEEETTEESFIMDEEEVSSSASNSAATICGNGVVDLEQDDHLSVSSSELVMQGDLQGTLITIDSATPQSIIAPKEADNAQSVIAHVYKAADDTTNLAPHKRPFKVHVGKQKIECDENGETDKTAVVRLAESCVTRIQQQLPTSHSIDSNDETFAVEEHENVCQADKSTQHAPTPKVNSRIIPQMGSANVSQLISRKILQHPTKHFKRQISLPASIFMSYLLEQNNKANYGKLSSGDAKMHHQNEEHHCEHNCDIIVKNKLNRSNSCSKRSAKPCATIMRSSLSKIDSYRSTKVIHGSTEDYEYDDINISNTCNDSSDDCSAEIEIAHPGVVNTSGDRDNLLLLNCAHELSGCTWESKSDTFTENNDQGDSEIDDEKEAFTSEVEKRSLILRHVRRLIRQDTTGNFAPPDFSI